MKWNSLLASFLLPQLFFAQTFTEVSSTPFDSVNFGAVVFADVDGDNDQDVFLTGSGNFALFCELYLNDGNGNFSEVSDSTFEPVSASYWLHGIFPFLGSLHQ